MAWLNTSLVRPPEVSEERAVSSACSIKNLFQVFQWGLLGWSGMSPLILRQHRAYFRFEVSTAMAMKNAVFWDVTPCGSCKNRHFGGI
jgi:hypothetical protein